VGEHVAECQRLMEAMGPMGSMMGGSMGPMMGWGLVGLLAWAALVAALVGLAIAAAAWCWRRREPAGMPVTARAALDLRYARGEIDREQYLLMRRDLEGG
jgi:putative membrane protein